MNLASGQVPPSWRFAFSIALLAAVEIVLAAAGVSVEECRAAERAPSGPSSARLRSAEGFVRIERIGAAGGVPAIVNQPLRVGDRIRTSEGRAELELADASILWIDRDSVVDLRALADPADRIDPGDVIELAQGCVQIAASDPVGSEVAARVDSAAASVYLLSAGLFRVEARRGLTTLVSFGGLAEFSGEDGSVLVRSGQRSVVPEGSAPTEPRRQASDRSDPFDLWVDARAELHAGPLGGVQRAELPERIEPYLAELARYGTWQKMPSIGPVWRPHQTVAWGPYLRGRWLAAPSGWFWISDEPWGWAPYRFGRWEQRIGLGWIWIPGSVWGGAWVAFAVGPTHVGWCPLDYYNQPVFAAGTAGFGGSGSVAARLDPRAWAFVPIDRFARPVTPQGVARADRLPRAGDLILTRRMPAFDPVRVAGSPAETERFVEDARRSGDGFAPARAGVAPVPFVSGEQEVRTASGAPGAARRRGLAPTARTAPAPTHPPRTAAANPDESRQGHAVERLVAGTHPDPNPRGATRPADPKTQSPPPPPRRTPRSTGQPAGAGSTRPPIPPPDDAPPDDSDR